MSDKKPWFEVYDIVITYAPQIGITEPRESEHSYGRFEDPVEAIEFASGNHPEAPRYEGCFGGGARVRSIYPPFDESAVAFPKKADDLPEEPRRENMKEMVEEIRVHCFIPPRVAVGDTYEWILPDRTWVECEIIKVEGHWLTLRLPYPVEVP